MKVSVLKNLYVLFVRLTNNPQWSGNWGLGLEELEMQIGPGGKKVKFGMICKLSDLLFYELSTRFSRFFSSLDEVSVCEDSETESEVLLLLLRCCLILLILLTASQNLLLEKGQIVLGILRKLSYLNLAKSKEKAGISFGKSISHAHKLSDDGCTTSSAEHFVASFEFLESSDPRPSFLSAILEVFVDELAVHGQLREFFKLIDSAASTGENLFTPHCGQGAIGVLVEVVCCHFSLSFSDQQAFGDSFNRLFLLNEEGSKHSFRPPEVGLSAAASLVLNSVILSAPKYVLAHVVLLVSEACSSMMCPNMFNVNRFLSIFEISVILYQKHMSCLQKESRSPSARISTEGRFQHCFESYLSPTRKQKMGDLLRMLDMSSDKYSQDIIVGMKSELVNSCIRYVKKGRNILDKSCSDEILPILSSLILRASDGFDDAIVHSVCNASLPDVYLICSLLKLMGISLQSAILCLRHNSSGGFRTLKDIISCKEYVFILGVIDCFKESSFHHPMQQQMANCMETISKHPRSRMMFIHFSGLLSLAFNSGLECLVMGCLLTIVAVVNLFAFEEGNLDALQPLVDCLSGHLSSGLPLVKVHESVGNQNSSLVVASKFQKLRTLHSRLKDSPATNCAGTEDGSSQDLALQCALNCTDDIMPLEEETEETTNGEIFLNCMMQHQKKFSSKSEFEDIADFIECKQGKDYSDWLKERQKYRNWKCEKMAVLRWKRKKMTWKQIKKKKN